VWIGNVYVPPVQNLQKRKIEEDVARSFTEDILGCIPQNANAVIVGDFNARIGELSPTTEEITIQRKSQDHVTNARA
jgi:hypothetical protein